MSEVAVLFSVIIPHQRYEYMSNFPPQNTASFTRNDLIEIFGTQVMASLPKNCAVSGISTDTRSLHKGNIFVALVGERFDAHSLLAEAVQKGASLLVVNESFLATNPSLDAPYIAVPNTLHALGALAHFHRCRFEIPIVAVAGAAGKTTTKELISCVLERDYTVLKTEGNFNNQVGVPLTLLRLEESHTAAVVEIGTNEPGEIEILSNIVAPTHGIITNIGKEHLEKLIDLDGVEREETELFRYLEQTGGTGILNLDDERLRKQAAYLPSQCSYSLAPRSERKADLSASVQLSASGEPVMRFAYKLGKQRATADVQLRIVGMTMAQNALAAAAVGCSLGVSLGNIVSALRSFVPTSSDAGYGRMVVEKLKTQGREITLLNDCYNANPTSMDAALTTLRTLPKAHAKQRKIAVLGDMRELGNSAREEHLRCVKELYTASWLDVVILLGEEMRIAFDTMNQASVRSSVQFAEDIAACVTALHAVMQEGDIVLIKGSRGMKLEQVIERLTSDN
ncbi:MAG: UDP-N-acetylmuramoyl-tripeptide--D-alanyl-D-alanine ligase [Candidatus Kapaibacterium sp.]|nr:MAG: UDP-N-acetylmuramoyl-tripeptide--D-alanyl-D-alanine ligase [Candidatus Kapabacteria bacterium]